MIEGYLRRLGLMDADGPVDYLDPQRMNLAKSWPTNGAIDSGINPQMPRPVRSSFPNPADYADEPPSRIGQAIDDYRAGKRDDTGAMLASAATNVASMPLKMMTLEGMYGLGKSAYDAFMTPYRVLTSPEPVTTEQMIEPAANIAMMAPMGAAGAHAAGVKMAPAERVAMANSKEGAVPGLLMDEASRMQRAREMGFDTGKTLYHGTGKDFEAFDPGTRGNGTRRNIYLTDRPEIADIYANSENYGLKGGGNPAIYPVYAKAEKPLVVSDKGPDGSFGWVHDNLEAALGVKARGARGYASLYDEARRQGYDQVQIREMIDLGGEQTQYIPLKPENIRSKFAAFDPAKADSANLLASNSREGAVPGIVAEFGSREGRGNGAINDPPGITAYHGSPHEFDKFSLDKIGTGEGAQAYGHGLYFAENEPTAKYYRDALSQKPTLDGQPLLDQSYKNIAATGEPFLDKAIKESFGDIALTRQTLEANIKSKPWTGGNGEFWQKAWEKRVEGSKAALAKLDELEKSGRIGNASPGHLYEVRINADPEHFLDWDKPLSQQSEKVREAALSIRNAAARAEYEKRGFPEPLIQEYLGNASKADKTGGQLVQGMKGADQSADFSQQLRDAGIPGIKYLDQGSRTAGEGSRNFVVFDDKLISIVRKYGWAGAAAMLGMSADDLMAQAQAAEQQTVKPDPYREALRMKARAKALGINP